MKHSFFKSFAILSLIVLSFSITMFAQQAQNAETPANSSAVRVGVTLPKTQFAEGVDNAQMANGLRELVGQYLKGTNVEIVAIDAKLPQLIAEEAKEKKCAYILQLAVSQKKGGGGFGMLKMVAPVLANVVPMAGMAGTAGAIAGSVAQTAIFSAANMASATKSKDQFTFEYALVSIEGGATKAGESIKARAKADGEDVLTPLVEQMAEKIVAAVK